MSLLQKTHTGASPAMFTPKDTYAMPTETLKQIVGTFEQEWDEHIAAAPQIVHYQGTYFQGEINLMLEWKVATIRGKCVAINVRKKIEEDGQWKGRWFAPEYQLFELQKAAMNELKWRREQAKKHEIRALESFAPVPPDQQAQDKIIDAIDENEIDVSEINF